MHKFFHLLKFLWKISNIYKKNSTMNSHATITQLQQIIIIHGPICSFTTPSTFIPKPPYLDFLKQISKYIISLIIFQYISIKGFFKINVNYLLADYSRTEQFQNSPNVSDWFFLPPCLLSHIFVSPNNGFYIYWFKRSLPLDFSNPSAESLSQR